MNSVSIAPYTFKGTTKEPRFGNPQPRIAECYAGMINSVGLQNPGVDAVSTKELKEMKTFFRKPVIANISGFSVEEFVDCAKIMDKEEQVRLVHSTSAC